jgi:serine/threonine protein phosphatase 1
MRKLKRPAAADGEKCPIVRGIQSQLAILSIVMTGRILAIGDIHGCLTALETLLAAMNLCPEDQLITLGDYIDRGPNSKGVLDRLIRLRSECQLTPILGNHEEMLLLARKEDQPNMLTMWLRSGGAATLDSYGFRTRPADLPEEHIAFVESCLPYFETRQHAFLHANYDADKPLDALHGYTLRWESLRERIPARHISGKSIIVGHTPQASGEILDRGYLKCIDTQCYAGGWLTGLEVVSGQLWQANEQGEVRTRESSN